MKVDLNKWYKCDIDKQVYQNLIYRSDWQGIKHVFLWIIVLVFSGYIAFINWGTWWAVFWFFVYGNIYEFCSINSSLAFFSHPVNF